jgi:uncharacterized membrane protein YphA (DoxX/SURF4 family)
VSIAYAIVAVVTALMLFFSASMKFRQEQRTIEIIHVQLEVPINWFPYLGTAEVAGGAGLLLGIAVAPIGVAAGVGLVLYFVGAVIAHLRKGDTKGLSAPMPVLVLSLAALVLRLLSL